MLTQIGNAEMPSYSGPLSKELNNRVQSPPASLGRRHALQQAIAILPRRGLEPAPTGPEEAALVGETEQIGCLPQRQMQPTEVLVRQLPPRVVQKLHERGLLFLQPPLQGSFAHAE